jgi:hypothetical protein
MRLFLDTALNDTWNYPIRGEPQPDAIQPHMVRLAWSLEGDEGPVAYASHLIKLPLGIRMMRGASEHTGIFDRDLEDYGVSQYSALSEFCEALSRASLIICHNWTHHRLVLERELRKPDEHGNARMWEITSWGIETVGMPAIWPSVVCTQIALTPVLKIERKAPGGGYLWPSFTAASSHLLGVAPPITFNPKNDGIDRLVHLRAFFAAIKRYERETSHA